MADLLNVKGLSELQKLLDTLPAKMEANVMRGALRAGMKPVMQEAKRNIAVESGVARDGLKISTSKRGGKITSKLKLTGEHSHIGHWLEFGTQAHIIPGPLRLFGGVVPMVKHPGAKAKPFMRPALDSEKGRALLATGEYIKKRLSQKHGLDTSHIEIEGDE